MSATPRRSQSFQLYYWGSAFIGLAVLGLTLRDAIPQLMDVRVAAFAVACMAVETLPIRTWSGSTFSVQDPLQVAFAVLYPPEAVFVFGFLTMVDPREFRGSVSLGQGLFNRTQSAVVQSVASLLFRLLGGGASPDWPVDVPAIAGASLAFYTINVGVVGFAIRLEERVPFVEACRKLLLGAPLASFASYLCLGCLGLFVARLVAISDGAEWVLAATGVALLVLSRGTFLHFAAIQRELEGIRERERLTRELSERRETERQDERLKLAGALHDEVIPLLHGVNLLARSSSPARSSEDLVQIGDSSTRVLAALRATVSELRNDELAGDLRTALEGLSSYTAVPVNVSVDVDDSEFSSSSRKLVYQIAREAVVNASAHAQARVIRISLGGTADSGYRLEVRDDGVGFDPDKTVVDHFGLRLMRERATALGGELDIQATGEGTCVSAVWR